MNFQTGDVSMSLNHGRFTDNNQCGYILKPAILRESKLYDDFDLNSKSFIDIDNTNFTPNNSCSAYLLSQRRPLKLELRVSKYLFMNFSFKANP